MPEITWRSIGAASDAASAVASGAAARSVSSVSTVSGASIAAVTRAAASHALERTVTRYAEDPSASSMMDCLVTPADFDLALEDVRSSSGDSDFAKEEEREKDDGQENDDNSEREAEESTSSRAVKEEAPRSREDDLSIDLTDDQSFMNLS